MAIQGTQVPMYTKYTVFVFFNFFKKFLYEKQNKPKLKRKTNKNKAIHKIRLIQNNKAKHTSNANKNKKRREKK